MWTRKIKWLVLWCHGMHEMDLDELDEFVVKVGPIAARLHRDGKVEDAAVLREVCAAVFRFGQKRDGVKTSGHRGKNGHREWATD